MSKDPAWTNALRGPADIDRERKRDKRFREAISTLSQNPVAASFAEAERESDSAKDSLGTAEVIPTRAPKGA